jgi:protease-4
MSGTNPEPDPESAADPEPERTETEEGDTTDPMALYERLRSLGGRVVGSYSAIVVAAVVVGVVLAPLVATVASQDTTGTVAVIPLEGGIDGTSAAALTGALQQARADPDVEAVVLRINSGGGSASASETMYLEISRTAEGMPVVSSVGSIAASGAYYAAVGSDRIFVKPASLAGNVGVLFTPPPQVEPNDVVISTGPSKLAGASERGWYYKTDAIQDAFVSAVVEGRGDALEIPRERVASAEVFTGAEAVETGMADEIGSTRDAVEHAAAQAGLDSYDVTVIRPQSNPTFLTRSAYLASDAPNRTMISVRYFLGEETGNQYPNFLMVPRGIVGEELAEQSRARTAAAGERTGPGTSAANRTDRPEGTPGGTPEPGTPVGTEVDDGY